MARGDLVEQQGLDEDPLTAQGFGSSDPLRNVEVRGQDKLYRLRVDLRPLC